MKLDQKTDEDLRKLLKLAQNKNDKFRAEVVKEMTRRADAEAAGHGKDIYGE